MVVVLQVVVGNHSQGLDERRVPLWFFLAAERRQVRLQHLGPYIIPIHSETSVPGEVVQPQGVEIGTRRVNGAAPASLQSLEDVHFGVERRVAEPHRRNIGRVARKRFGHQARRIGEVDQERARGQFAHCAGDLQDDRDGPQGLGHPSNAGGLLTDETVAPAEVFVLAPRPHPTNPELGDDIARASDGFPLVRRQAHREWLALRCYHALCKSADDVQSLL